MVDLDEAVIARIKKGEETFEVLVDCEKAIDFRNGKASLDEALVTEKVFKDAKKGLKASEHEMEKLLETSDSRLAAEKIIKGGEIQLTAEYKNKLRQEKKNRIITMISRDSINPKNNLSHPRDRIERAMEEVKINIDEFKKAEDQIKDVVAKISGVLPIKLETRELQIIIPAKSAGQSYGILKNKGKLLKDEWLGDGSLSAVLEIPAGLQEELESELNKLTQGEVQISILKKK